MRVVLLDVGGTLWPDQPVRPGSDDGRSDALAAVVPLTDVRPLLRDLRAAATALEGAVEQDTLGLVRSALAAHGVDPNTVDPERVRSAMVVPARAWLPLFPGATDLLRSLRTEGFRTLLVTNAAWRRGTDYVRDLSDVGVAEYVEAVFSSVDIGRRKPDPALFLSALAAAGARPDQAIVVGNRGDLDIIPALTLGMAAVQVCIEDPRPARSWARWMVSSLAEVLEACRAWSLEGEATTSA